MSWTCQIPKELSVQPLPFVALTGLEIKHNAVHKEIWDNFNIRSNLKFRYKLLDGDHEYPKSKPKVLPLTPQKSKIFLYKFFLNKAAS